MTSRSCILLVSILLLLLAGCASVAPSPSASPATPGAAPEVLPPALSQETLPQPPGGAVIIEPVPKQAMSGNPAVIALLDRAQIDTETGHREAAGASLERGLRIEPRNAWLWHELAQLRLTQGQYAQAISMAKKSISFAGRDRRLLAADWRVIGNAHVAQGSTAAAEQAFKLATDFEQSAQMEADHGF